MSCLKLRSKQTKKFLKGESSPFFFCPAGNESLFLPAMNGPQKLLISTSYLGPISYFSRIAHAELVQMDLFEHYLKQTYRNRCLILTANGIHPLSIPVIKVNGNHTLVRDIQISNREKWQLNHWRAISSAYSNSPYFLFYENDFQSVFFKGHKLLWQFNEDMIKVILRCLGLSKSIIYSSAYVSELPTGSEDLRLAFSPKKVLETPFPAYSQVFDDRFTFAPDLSILDLLFNLGPDAKDYLLGIPRDISNVEG